MARLEIEQIPVLSDNYVYLAHDPSSQATAAIDPALAAPVLDRLAAKGWRLSHIFNTHHHNDHVGGNLELKAKTGCSIIGYGPDARRIPGIDVRVADGDTVALGNCAGQVMAVPGHTLGHIAFWFPESLTLFAGDTLFALGCGRLFEGTAENMWSSLAKLRALPGATQVFCAHEYTQSNARFARTIERGNDALDRRCADIDRLRAAGLPTVPFALDLDRATNPFLRADIPAVKAAAGMDANADPALVFGEIRKRKDVF